MKTVNEKKLAIGEKIEALKVEFLRYEFHNIDNDETPESIEEANELKDCLVMQIKDLYNFVKDVKNDN